MQKSNDNEIVQYLGVKHIINYLGVQVGLTQTLHFRRLLAILCLGHMEWGGVQSTVFVSNSLCTYMHTYVCGCVCLAVHMCACVCVCIYVNI